MHRARRAVNPLDGPGPMYRPCQSDSFAENMEGQIIGIACGSVGTHFMGGGVQHNMTETDEGTYYVEIEENTFYLS